jgi:hypothetical protein
MGRRQSVTSSLRCHSTDYFPLKIKYIARHQWLTPEILATQEAEIRRIMVQSQSR